MGTKANETYATPSGRNRRFLFGLRYTSLIPERDGGCTPVPTVFDNYGHIFIRQTFRTGLVNPVQPHGNESKRDLRNPVRP